MKKSSSPQNNRRQRPPTSGIKRFFSWKGIPSRRFEVRGIGILEQMPPCLIERPRGTSDFMFMLFHDEACAGAKPDWEKLHEVNTMMIWPAGQPQYYGNRTNSFAHSWIHCSGGGLKEILMRSKLPTLQPIAVKEPAIFQLGLSELLNELVAYTRPDSIIVQNLFELCLRRIGRLRTDTKNATPVPEKLLSVQRMISSVPAENITLDDMAKMAGLSAPYFCSRFKKTFGTSPMESLIHHRLHHAAHLLTNRNLNISEIAAQVGYEDLFHFSKMFKKKFGVSPRKMRTLGLAQPRSRSIK